MPAQSMTSQDSTEDFFAVKSNTGPSLQDNFKKFRQAKIQAAKEAAAASNSGSTSNTTNSTTASSSSNSSPVGENQTGSGSDFKTFPRNPEEKKILRKKWVEKLKSYLGVGYHRRYCDTETEEGQKELEEGLFLDCCGLLRQVSADLQQPTDSLTGEVGFGWKLGRWNQTYQYALCEATVLAGGESKYRRNSVEELEEGDLIFYEADYIDTRKKPQHWDITHIEIYLGPNNQSLGSRWKQRVSLHDTYELGTDSHPSQLWKVKGDRKFHYFSLDAWLDHKGPCPPAWDESTEMGRKAMELFGKTTVGDSSKTSNAKSIFYVGAED